MKKFERLMHRTHYWSAVTKLAKERVSETGKPFPVYGMPSKEETGDPEMVLVSLKKQEKRLAHFEDVGAIGDTLSREIAFWKEHLFHPGEGGEKKEFSGRKCQIHLRLAHKVSLGASQDFLRAGSVVNKEGLPPDLQKVFTDAEIAAGKALHKYASLFMWALQWNYTINQAREKGLEIEAFVVPVKA